MTRPDDHLYDWMALDRLGYAPTGPIGQVTEPDPGEGPNGTKVLERQA